MLSLKRKLLSLGLLLMICGAFVTFGTSNAKANWDDPTASCSLHSAWVGDTVTANFNVNNGDSDVIIFSSCSFSIDYGGGTKTQVNSMSGTMSMSSHSSTAVSGSFTVPQVSDGTYDIVLKIVGKASGDILSTTYTWTFHLAVKNIPDLTVDVQALTNSGIAPLSTSFTSTVNGGDGSYSYFWTFGDGSTSTSASPSHTYSAAGSYVAKLTVTDGHSNTESDTATITVTPALSVALSPSSSSGTSPLEIEFTSIATGGDGVYSYSWTFGDGSTSTLANPSHTYNKAGIYDVKITVTDNGGRTSTDTGTVTVTAPSALDLTNTTGSGPILLLGIVAIVIVAAILVVVLVVRKKKTSPPGPPPMMPPKQ